MKYKILENNHRSNLEDEVNNFLNSGWTLQGGISVSKRGDGFHGYVYVQAMTKVNP